MAVADLSVVDGVSLHDVEESLLADAVLLLEEVVLGVGAGNVPPDDLLTSRLGLHVLGILGLVLGLVGVAQQLPSDASKVVGDPFPHQLL